MFRIGTLVNDVLETRHAPYLFSRLPRHAGVGGDGAASGGDNRPDADGGTAGLDTYADIAAASYRDSHQAAIILRAATATLTAAPTKRHLAAARQAWREARAPYQQAEVFRFGNTAVDDWEGKVNA